jgi:hypothetical protein
MASLALLVTIIFLSVLIIGPISYLISLFDWMPKLIVWTLGLLCIFVGGMAFTLPVVFLKIVGLVDVAIGFKILYGRQEKKTGA